jgi:hypothetical protein
MTRDRCSTYSGALFRRAVGEHRGGSRNEIAVAVGQAPVRQNRRVLQTGPDAVSTRDGAPIDRPGRDAVAMVHLLERYPCLSDYPFDRVCMRHRRVRVGIERFDHRPDAAGSYVGSDETARVVEGQPATLSTPLISGGVVARRRS